MYTYIFIIIKNIVNIYKITNTLLIYFDKNQYIYTV